MVDETRRTGGVAEGLISELGEAGYTGSMARVTGADCFLPLGEAANLALVQQGDVEAAALRMLA